MKLKKLGYGLKALFNALLIIQKLKSLRVQSDITYYDIGSAGGPPLLYRFLMKFGYLNYLGFDPDDSWMSKEKVIDKLFKLPTGDHMRVALGDDEQEKTLFITSFPECSSFLRPDLSAISNSELRRLFMITDEIKMKTRRLDEVIQIYDLSAPDILKIDVQGYELNVLSGLGNYLSEIFAIEMEVRVMSLYQDEPSFSEVNSFLYQHGFILLDIKRQGPFGDEFLEANAYWAKIPKTKQDRAVYEFFRRANNIMSGTKLIDCDI